MNSFKSQLSNDELYNVEMCIQRYINQGFNKILNIDFNALDENKKYIIGYLTMMIIKFNEVTSGLLNNELSALNFDRLGIQDRIYQFITKRFKSIILINMVEFIDHNEHLKQFKFDINEYCIEFKKQMIEQFFKFVVDELYKTTNYDEFKNDTLQFYSTIINKIGINYVLLLVNQY